MLKSVCRIPRLLPRGLSPRRLSPREDDDIHDFRPASVALSQQLFLRVTIFPVHLELRRVFTDNLWLKSKDREGHTDYELHDSYMGQHCSPVCREESITCSNPGVDI